MRSRRAVTQLRENLAACRTAWPVGGQLRVIGSAMFVCVECGASQLVGGHCAADGTQLSPIGEDVLLASAYCAVARCSWAHAVASWNSAWTRLLSAVVTAVWAS